MSQMDYRNSSAARRARTDGSRKEDDWTCPSCGNVNFPFRTTCNMRNCTQSRPAEHNSKYDAKPVQGQQSYSSSAYIGTCALSSMYMGVPPYGSSLFNGSSIPPYDIRFPGGSTYHYSYGSSLSAGSAYRLLHLSGPAPYSGGSMIGNGGMYGVPPLVDRFGMALPMGPPTMGPRPGYFLDDKSQKKTVCNMKKCNTPKHGYLATKSDKSSKQKMPEGSWKCEKCDNMNYPFRTKCNRQNCDADKPAESNTPPSQSPDEIDQ